jgi:hypothetical protein
VSLRRTYHAAEALQPGRPLRDPVLVDDNQDRRFLAAVGVAFRGLRSRLHPHVPMILNPRFRESGPDEVMHLVDMVCGASGAYLKGNREWHDLIRSRCVGLMSLP